MSDVLAQKQIEMLDRQEKLKKEAAKKHAASSEAEEAPKKKKRKSSKKDGDSEGKSSKKKKSKKKDGVNPANAQYYSMGAYDDDEDGGGESAPSSASANTALPSSVTTPGGQDGAGVGASSEGVSAATPVQSAEKSERKKARKDHLLGLITFKIIEFLQEDTSKKYTFQNIMESIDYNNCTNQVDEDEEKKKKTTVSLEDSLTSKLEDKTKKEIFLKLKENQKVDYTPGPTKTKGIDEAATFSFKAIHQSVKNKDDILNLLKHPEFVISGIPSGELAESYKLVGEDIEELKKGKYIIAIFNQDKKGDILYYNDPGVAMPSTLILN